MNFSPPIWLLLLLGFLQSSAAFQLDEKDQDGRYCWQISDANSDRIHENVRKIVDQYGAESDESAQELNAQMEKSFGGGWLSITGTKYYLKLTSARQFCAIKYKSHIITVVKYAESADNTATTEPSEAKPTAKPVRLMPWEGKR